MRMYKLEDIRKIHLEVTQRCQASCPMCDRNQNGGKLNPHIDLSELSLEDCKKIFSLNFIKQLDTLMMCGNLGDPIIANDTLEKSGVQIPASQQYQDMLSRKNYAPGVKHGLICND